MLTHLSICVSNEYLWQSFVTACGVRKVWSREFKDILDDKAAQIRRLKSILADLGMSGRLSMEKAKAIRAKRELAQELGSYWTVDIKYMAVLIPRAQRMCKTLRRPLSAGQLHLAQRRHRPALRQTANQTKGR